MSPLWLLVFLTWYHLSAGSEAEDFKTAKDTITVEPSDAMQQQPDYETFPTDDYAEDRLKFDHLFTPSENDEDDLMIYSITFGDGSPYAKYPYPPTMNDNNTREKRSKYQRSTENIFNAESPVRQSKQPPFRSNIYNLLLHAKNIDSITNQRPASNSRNPLIKIDSADKRNAKFHAWGGKRNNADFANAPPSPYIDVDPAVFYENMKNTYNTNDRKRARFSSWGGKRLEDETTGPKTLPFRPWGGKKDKPDILVWPKYTPFKAWGGKRSESIGFYPPDDQALNNLLKKNNRNRRPRFHSWGGKRNDGRPVGLIQKNSLLEKVENNPLIIRHADDANDLSFVVNDKAEKRARFNAWGGKRNDGKPVGLIQKNSLLEKVEDNPLIIRHSDDANDLSFFVNDKAEKRARFNAWGGKRSPEIANLELGQIGDYAPYKKSFHSWGGKRTSTSTEPDVTDDEIYLTSFDI